MTANNNIIKSNNLDNTFDPIDKVKTIDPLQPDQMEQSPNHEEPFKPTQMGHPDKKKHPERTEDSDDPIPGEPVLGSDKGPWTGSDANE